MFVLIVSVMFYWMKISSYMVKWFDFMLIIVDVFVWYFLFFVFGIELIVLMLNVYLLRWGGYLWIVFYLLFFEILIKKIINLISD